MTGVPRAGIAVEADAHNPLAGAAAVFDARDDLLADVAAFLEIE